jgi:prepilin-type N-terminal cleavage/methylation domain-containing protein
MERRKKHAGFSLVEVAIAVGIFAVAATGILAVLPALAAQPGESADLLAAQGLAGPVRIELQRLARSGFDALADAVPVMAAPLQNGFSLVAVRDGLYLHSRDYLPPPPAAQIPTDARYFLVEAWRFDQAPLRYDSSAAVLAVYVRVSWPYRVPGAAAATPQAARNQFTFTAALVR